MHNDALLLWIGGLALMFIFYILPFLLAIVLPAWGIPTLIKTIVWRKKGPLPSLWPFILSMIVLAIAANMLWHYSMFNTIYFDWDLLFLPYTFFWHESPVLDGSSSWIASGWTQQHLFILWLGITEFIYISSAIVAYLKNRKTIHGWTYPIILIVSVMTLSITSVVLTIYGNTIFSFIWKTPPELEYQDVPGTCLPPATAEAQIIYSGDMKEWLSDLSGAHIRPVSDKYLQIEDTRGISPDRSMIATVQGGSVWIHCLYTNGAFHIPLPEASLPKLMQISVSWSPDSTSLLMHYNGSLLQIRPKDRSSTVLKKNIALRDNNIDITAKGRDVRIPPFEIGDAYWSPNGTIYYTAFDGDTVLLHGWNPQTDTDTILFTHDGPIAFVSGDPAGKWILLSLSSWATKRNNMEWNQFFLFNTRTNERSPWNENTSFDTVWSPSGRFYAQSTGSWKISPNVKEFPSVLVDLETNQSVIITEAVKNTIGKPDILKGEQATVVQIRDFIDDSTILISIQFPGKGIDIPRQINCIFNVSTGNYTILQEYPAQTYGEKTDSERLTPLGVLKKL